MAATSATFEGIKKQIASGECAPLYVVHGEEAFYVDELVKAFEAMAPESERDFNLYQLYAPQTTPTNVIDTCMRYPFMADRQVVILKEAQVAGANFIDKLESYAAHPNPSTIFVVVGRGKALSGAKFFKALRASGGVVYESKKLYERDILPVIDTLIRQYGLSIDDKARSMLLDHVGTSLSRIHNEIGKIHTALPHGAVVTPHVIEKLIGISKDYNNFELIDAIATRNVGKAFAIAEYFRRNPKNNPTNMTVSLLFGYFAKLLMVLYGAGVSLDQKIADGLGNRVSNQEFNRIKISLQNYNGRQIIAAITACRRFDCRSKGIGSRADQFDLFEELLFQIFS